MKISTLIIILIIIFVGYYILTSNNESLKVCDNDDTDNGNTNLAQSMQHEHNNHGHGQEQFGMTLIDIDDGPLPSQQIIEYDGREPQSTGHGIAGNVRPDNINFVSEPQTPIIL